MSPLHLLCLASNSFNETRHLSYLHTDTHTLPLVVSWLAHMKGRSQMQLCVKVTVLKRSSMLTARRGVSVLSSQRGCDKKEKYFNNL